MRPTAIRRLRARRGWTQAQLAARLGTDPVTVSRWERGVSRPRPSALARLRELAGVVPNEVAELVRVLGEREAIRALRKPLLLTHARRRVRFPVPPARRLAAVEEALREQESLRKAVR